jgi:hypothetical protein
MGGCFDAAAGEVEVSNFTGRYEGSDSLEVADLPYEPDPCKELWLGAAGEAR